LLISFFSGHPQAKSCLTHAKFSTHDVDHAQDFLNRSCSINAADRSLEHDFHFALSHIRAKSVLIIGMQGTNFYSKRYGEDDTTFLFPITGHYHLKTETTEIDFDHQIIGSVLTGADERHFNLHHGSIINLNIANETIKRALCEYSDPVNVTSLLSHIQLKKNLTGIDHIRNDVEFFIKEYQTADFSLIDRDAYDDICETVMSNTIARFLTQKIDHKRLCRLDQKIILKAIDYMHEHFATLKTVNEVARYLNISLNELEIGFRAYEQCTPIFYLAQLRLHLAAHLVSLYGSHIHLNHIAHKCGFLSARHMNIWHKKIFRHDFICRFNTESNVAPLVKHPLVRM